MIDTSLEAYKEALLTINHKQNIVYNTIRHSHRPLCNDDIARKLYWPINRVTPRVKELRDKGLLVDDGKRVGPQGRNVHFWRVKKQETLF